MTGAALPLVDGCSTRRSAACGSPCLSLPSMPTGVPKSRVHAGQTVRQKNWSRQTTRHGLCCHSQRSARSESITGGILAPNLRVPLRRAARRRTGRVGSSFRSATRRRAPLPKGVEGIKWVHATQRCDRGRRAGWFLGCSQDRRVARGAVDTSVFRTTVETAHAFLVSPIGSANDVVEQVAVPNPHQAIHAVVPHGQTHRYLVAPLALLVVHLSRKSCGDSRPRDDGHVWRGRRLATRGRLHGE